MVILEHLDETDPLVMLETKAVLDPVGSPVNLAQMEKE